MQSTTGSWYPSKMLADSAWPIGKTVWYQDPELMQNFLGYGVSNMLSFSQEFLVKGADVES